MYTNFEQLLNCMKTERLLKKWQKNFEVEKGLKIVHISSYIGLREDKKWTKMFSDCNIKYLQILFKTI